MINQEGDNLCRDEATVSDDYGDNYATFVCKLDRGHESPHTDTWGGEDREAPYRFTWGDRTQESQAQRDLEDRVWMLSESLPHADVCRCFDCEYPKYVAEYGFDNRWRSWWIFHLNTVGSDSRVWVFGLRFRLWKLEIDWSMSWTVWRGIWQRWKTGDEVYLYRGVEMSYEELENQVHGEEE